VESSQRHNLHSGTIFTAVQSSQRDGAACTLGCEALIGREKEQDGVKRRGAERNKKEYERVKRSEEEGSSVASRE
jgi:hypothetical protein